MVSFSDQNTQVAGSISVVARRTGGDCMIHELDEGNTVVVGQSSGCGMCLSHESVAARHCILTLNESELVVRQWTEVPSFLNGQLIEGEADLRPGDKLQIGDYVLEFEQAGEAGNASTLSASPSSEFVVTEPTVAEPPAATAPSPQLVSPPQESRLESPQFESPQFESPQFESPQHACLDDDIGPPTAAAPMAASPPIDVPAGLGNELSRTPEFDVPAEQTEDVQSNSLDWMGDDLVADETIELLREEVESLEGELQQRRTQLNELTNGAFCRDPAQLEAEPVDDSCVLARIDEMLDELSKSDERVGLLEEMLAASEDAANAQQEERRQLESWVEDIEKRISARQSEWEEEIASLRDQVLRLKSQRDEVEHQLQAAASAGESQHQYEGLLKRLRVEGAELEKKLQASETQRDSLQRRVESAEFQGSLEGQQEMVERALREERAKLAQEWASVSRTRADLAVKLKEAGEQHERSPLSPADQRVQALREHLKEIHQDEREVETDRGLISRLSGLWQRLE